MEAVYTHVLESGINGQINSVSDDDLRTAFYYAIRSNDRNILKTLLDLDDVDEKDVDSALYGAYQELKLKDVHIAPEVEYTTIAELTKRRFLSNDPSVKKFPPDLEAMIESLADCTNLLIRSQELNQQFFFIAKFICQNIYMLKRLLKDTYDSLPWEEMEFCLIIFIYSHTKQDKSNILYKTLLGENKIKTYLSDFVQCLNDVWSTIAAANKLKTSQKGKKQKDSTNRDKPAKPRNVSRQQLIESVKNKHPGKFDGLYVDFLCVRDIYTLNQINDRIVLASAANPNTANGKLTITRCLQFIGESIKNTKDSPKLSEAVADLIQTAAPQNTRDIIMRLRNSLSHKESHERRKEIEENKNIKYFTNIQNDIVKIQYSIAEIHYKYKLKVLKSFIKKIADSKSSEAMKYVVETGSDVSMESFCLNENFKADEHKRIERIVARLKRKINVEQVDILSHKSMLFDEIEKVLDIKRDSIDRARELFRKLNIISHFFLANNVNIDNFDFLKKLAAHIYEVLTEDTNSSRQFSVIQNTLASLCELNKMGESNEYNEIIADIKMIFYIVDNEMTNIESIRDFKEKLTVKHVAVNTTNVCTNVQQHLKKQQQLRVKIENLRDALNQAVVFNDHDFYADTSEDVQNVYSTIEMLVLDVMTILNDSLKCLVENNFVLFDDPPIMYGKCFRNFLAHDNSLMDILTNTPWKNVLSNAEILVSLDPDDISSIYNRDSYNYNEIVDRFVKSLLRIGNQLLMYEALENGDLEGVTASIEDGADVKGHNVLKQTSLHMACRSGNMETVRWVVEQGVDVHEADINGLSALHVAAACGAASAAKYLICEKGAEVDCVNGAGQTPLHLASLNGHKETVEILLRNGADIFVKDNEGYLPPCCAVQRKHLDIIEAMNDKMNGFVVSKCLHTAIDFGYVDIIDYILKQFPNEISIENIDSLGRVIMYGHIDVIKFLISKGIKLDVDEPIHNALVFKNKEIVKILLENGANVNVFNKWRHATPLHVAVSNGLEDIVETLINHGADVDAVMIEGQTPLHLAVGENHENIFKILLQKNALICRKSFKDKTCLHYAAFSGNLNIAKTLIEMDGSMVHCRDVNGKTPLHVAVFKGHHEMVKLLLERGANVNSMSNDEIPMLMVAVRMAHIDICKTLLSLNVDVDPPFLFTPLHLAARVGSVDIVNLLIGVASKNIDAVDANGSTPLIYAVTDNQKKCVEIFLERGAKLSYDGESVLELAITLNHSEIFEILLREKIKRSGGTNVDLDSLQLAELISIASCEEKYAWLSATMHLGKSGMVGLFLQDKSIDVTHPVVIQAFCEAINYRFRDVAKLFIDRGVDCNTVFQGSSVLWISACLGHEDIVSDLLEAGADVHFKNEDILTPLHIAIIKKHCGVVTKLLTANSDPNEKGTVENILPLEMAIYSHNLTLVRTFCQNANGLDLNVTLKMNLPLTHVCIVKNMKDILECLINEGVDLHIPNDKGLKPLHFAAALGRNDILQLLLRSGCDISDTTKNKLTALHFAAMEGHVDTVKIILKYNPNINAVDRFSKTPLNSAISKDHVTVVKILMNNGAFVNADACCFIAVQPQPNESMNCIVNPTVKLFVTLERDHDVSDVSECIDSGAMVNARNAEGVTPLVVAVKRSKLEVVSLLLNNGADPNAAVNGSTPLHFAAQNNQRDIVIYLLSYGAIYNLSDKKGKKPISNATDTKVVEFLSSIDGYFNSVKKGCNHFIDELKTLTTFELKAVMCAFNSQNYNLITFAIYNEFKEVEQLKNIQGDEWKTMIENLESEKHLKNALEVLSNVETKKREIFGKNDPAILSLLKTKLNVLLKHNLFKESVDLLEDMYERLKISMGETNTETLKMGSVLVILLDSIEMDKRVLEVSREVFEGYSKVGKENTNTALKTQIAASCTLLRLNRYDEALEILKILSSKEKHLEKVDFLKVLSNMASVYLNQSNCIKALETYQAAAQCSEKIYGRNSVETFFFLKQFHVLKGNQDTIIEFHKRALQILPPSHPKYPVIKADMEQFVSDKQKPSDEVQAMHVYLAIDKDDLESLIDLFEHKHSRFSTKTGSDFLFYAIRRGAKNMVRQLLVFGVNPLNVQQDGLTALMAASLCGNGDVLETIIAEIDARILQYFINVQTELMKNTALHLAVKNNNVEAVKVLLKHGASTDKCNRMGKNPKDCTNNQDIKNLFVELKKK